MKKVLILLIAFTHLITLNAQYCIDGRFTQNDYFDESDVVTIVNKSYGFANNWYNDYPQPLLNSFDISYPDMSVDPLEKRPVIVFAHGGGFWGGEKEAFAYHMLDLAKSGYVVVSMNYRKGWAGSPEDCAGDPASLAEAVYRAMQDVQACFRYLVVNAAEFGIDTSMIFAGGESAGVYAMMNGIFMTEDEWVADHPTHLDLFGTLNNSTNNYTTDFTIKGMISMWGGIYDTLYMGKDEIVPMISFYGISDDVIPPTSGPIKFCEGYEMVYGAVAMQEKLNNEGICNVMHKNLFAGHEAYPAEYTSDNIACFLKSILCDQCNTYEVNDAVADCSAMTVTSVYDLNKGNISIYPNPASNAITMDLSAIGTNNLVITFYDVTGKIINVSTTLTGNQLNADISKLPIGVYMVSAVNGGVKVDGKFVKG